MLSANLIHCSSVSQTRDQVPRLGAETQQRDIGSKTSEMDEFEKNQTLPFPMQSLQPSGTFGFGLPVLGGKSSSPFSVFTSVASDSSSLNKIESTEMNKPKSISISRDDTNSTSRAAAFSYFFLPI